MSVCLCLCVWYLVLCMYWYTQYRRLFNWFSYILFLYNGFIGIIGGILRILITTGISLLLLFRLDAVTLPRGFDFFDIGMLKYYKTNVVLTFSTETEVLSC